MRRGVWYPTYITDKQNIFEKEQAFYKILFF